MIRQTVALEPEAGLRPKLRDEAVKFLVLREVLAHEPELPTGAPMDWFLVPEDAAWLFCPKTTRSYHSGTSNDGSAKCAFPTVWRRDWSDLIGPGVQRRPGWHS